LHEFLGYNHLHSFLGTINRIFVALPVAYHVHHTQHTYIHQTLRIFTNGFVVVINYFLLIRGDDDPVE